MLNTVNVNVVCCFFWQAIMCKGNVAQRRALKLDSTLADKMNQTSQLMTHEDDDTTASRKVGFIPKPCHHFGLCVCQTQVRRDIYHFWKNVSCLFRRIFLKRKQIPTEARKLLDDNRIFLQLSKSSQGNPNATRGGAVEDEWDEFVHQEIMSQRFSEPTTAEDYPFPSCYHYHIGYINLSTYHFGLLEMQRLDYQQQQNQSKDITVLSLPPKENEGEVLVSDMEAFAKLDLRCSWTMTILTLNFQHDEDWSFQDGDCSLVVAPMPSLPQYIVWHGSESEASRRKVAEQARNQDRKKNQPSQKGKRVYRGNPRGEGPTKKRKKNQVVDKQEDPIDMLLDDVEYDATIARPDLIDVLLESENDQNEQQEIEQTENPYIDVTGAEDEEDIEVMTEGGHSEPNNSPRAMGSEEEGEDDNEKQHVFNLDEAEDDLLEKEFFHHAAPARSLDAPEPPQDKSNHPTDRAISKRSTANRDIFHIAGLGELRYYRQSGTMSAICLAHASSDCRRTATTMPTKRASGRPIGHLIAWLQLAGSYESRTTHVHTCRPTLEQRRAAREYFETLDEHETFGELERPRAPGEPNEPKER